MMLHDFTNLESGREIETETESLLDLSYKKN